MIHEVSVVSCETEAASHCEGETDIQRFPKRKVLRRMFGLKRNEVVGGWRKLHRLIANTLLLILLRLLYHGDRWAEQVVRVKGKIYTYESCSISKVLQPVIKHVFSVGGSTVWG
jgi:hypothetical protein